jgi:hypothetical protein
VHEKLVDAIRTKDLKVIEKAFAEHTVRSAEELIPLLDAASSKKE